MKWRSKSHSHQPQQQPASTPEQERQQRRHSSSSASSFLSRAFVPNNWISKIKQTLTSSKPKSHASDHHQNKTQQPNSEPAKPRRTQPATKTTCGGGARVRQPLSSVSDHLSFVINTTFPEELPRHSYCGDEDLKFYMARREQSIAGGGRARRIGGSFGSSRSGIAEPDVPPLSSCRSCRSDFGRCKPAKIPPGGESTTTMTADYGRSRGGSNRTENDELVGSELRPVQTREAADPSSNPRRSYSSLSGGGRVRRRSKKVKVHSPRVRRRRSGGGARKSLESFAVVKCSVDPPRDFRESMVEMILENEMGRPEELERLLACYLSLNSDEYHDVIVKAFRQVWFELSRCRTPAGTKRRDGDLCRF